MCDLDVKFFVFVNYNKWKWFYGGMEDYGDNNVVSSSSNGESNSKFFEIVVELCFCEILERLYVDMNCDLVGVVIISGSDGNFDGVNDVNLVEKLCMVCWFWFFVIDMGIGIVVDKLDLLFEKFM